jgi:hypothetical protein
VESKISNGREVSNMITSQGRASSAFLDALNAVVLPVQRHYEQEISHRPLWQKTGRNVIQWLWKPRMPAISYNGHVWRQPSSVVVLSLNASDACRTLVVWAHDPATLVGLLMEALGATGCDGRPLDVGEVAGVLINVTHIVS